MHIPSLALLALAATLGTSTMHPDLLNRPGCTFLPITTPSPTIHATLITTLTTALTTALTTTASPLSATITTRPSEVEGAGKQLQKRKHKTHSSIDCFNCQVSGVDHCDGHEYVKQCGIYDKRSINTLTITTTTTSAPLPATITTPPTLSTPSNVEGMRVQKRKHRTHSSIDCLWCWEAIDRMDGTTMAPKDGYDRTNCKGREYMKQCEDICR